MVATTIDMKKMAGLFSIDVSIFGGLCAATHTDFPKMLFSVGRRFIGLKAGHYSLPGAPSKVGHDGEQLARANRLRHMYLEA